jgi:hypothetical protein
MQIRPTLLTLRVGLTTETMTVRPATFPSIALEGLFARKEFFCSRTATFLSCDKSRTVFGKIFFANFGSLKCTQHNNNAIQVTKNSCAMLKVLKTLHPGNPDGCNPDGYTQATPTGTRVHAGTG